MLSLLAIILSLLLVVGLHEAGHAWAARLFKVRIKRVSIGFGKIILSRQGKNGCQWAWSLWPVGGSIVYALVEKIRGKPVSVGMEILLHRLVFIAFCLILVQLLLNDFQRNL